MSDQLSLLGLDAGPEDVLRSFASFLSSAASHSLSGRTFHQEPIISVSVLEHYFPAQVSNCDDDNNQFSCIVPSLALKPNNSDSSGVKASLSAGASVLDTAASNFSRPITVHKAELHALPSSLIDNIHSSFMSLVESRLRSSSVALLSQAQQRNNGVGNDNLIRLLGKLLSSSSKPVAPTTMATTFRIPGPPIKGADGNYVVPIVLDLIADLNILGSSVTVTMEGPGVMMGYFADPASSPEVDSRRPSFALKGIEVVLETQDLLKSMMKTVREAVRKAVGMSTQLALRVPGINNGHRGIFGPSLQEQQQQRKEQLLATLNEKLLSSAGKFHMDQQDRNQQSTTDIDAANNLMPPPPSRQSSSQELLSTAFTGVRGPNSPPQSRSVDSVPNLWADKSELSILPALLQLKRELKDNNNRRKHDECSGDVVNGGDSIKRQRLSNLDLLAMNADMNKSAAAAARMEQRMKERQNAINDIVFSSGNT